MGGRSDERRHELGKPAHGQLVVDAVPGGQPLGQGIIIPAEQILGPGKVVNGIAEVLQVIEDPKLAWDFLSREWPFADERVRPIDKLRAGDIEDVLNAAPSFGSAFT